MNLLFCACYKVPAVKKVVVSKPAFINGQMAFNSTGEIININVNQYELEFNGKKYGTDHFEVLKEDYKEFNYVERSGSDHVVIGDYFSVDFNYNTASVNDFLQLYNEVKKFASKEEIKKFTDRGLSVDKLHFEWV